MRPELERLLHDALALGARDRACLAAKLIESLESESADEDHDAAWTAEIERRRAELDSGEVRSVSVEELFARLGAGSDDSRR